MVNRQHGKRTCVLIVEPEVDVGLTLADWLAARGYQAVLVRSVEAALEELRDIRPQVVVVGRGHAEPAAQIGLSELLLLIQTVCPGVPVITIADQASEDLTPVVFRQLLVQPVEFTQISHVLQSEFSSAPAAVASSSTTVIDTRSRGH